MCDLSWFSNPVLASLLGVAVGGIVGAVATYVLTELTDRRRTSQVNVKRRSGAYRLLQGILEEIRAERSNLATAQLTGPQHQRIIVILAEFSDVLHDEVVSAWDNVRPTLAVNIAYPTYAMDLTQFAEQVRIHYERLRPENPYHHLDFIRHHSWFRRRTQTEPS